jgi:hypothetical protein
MERGYQGVEIESDAQEVAKLLKELGIGRSKIVNITHEVKDHSECFIYWRYVHLVTILSQYHFHIPYVDVFGDFGYVKEAKIERRIF